ncbi:nucleotide pyrophosphohydrolase [Halorubellus salinus]|uniref:nucleotide pyrophosphohydrolase n=1 Tax=Halorubellus salinus TaxID=755309 RepID=UPI001D078EEC|nr:nucleotide pyrophosphohydrolase [Halorubellus salinus]
MSDDFDDLRERYAEFVAAREWGQFHTPQNLAMAVSIEANELLEEFLWFNNPAAERVQERTEKHEAVRKEIADVMIYCIALCHQLDIDPAIAIAAKMEANEHRFDEEIAAEITEELQRWQ